MVRQNEGSCERGGQFVEPRARPPFRGAGAAAMELYSSKITGDVLVMLILGMICAVRLKVGETVILLTSPPHHY